LFVPAIGKLNRRFAIAQVVADQGALACALERHRRAHGQFPDRLEALVPQLLPAIPHDVLTGEPPKYRRTPEGGFVLYSIGWDHDDDHGTPGNNLFDTEGDWVWRCPAPKPSA
jgi:hypothetical protein